MFICAHVQWLWWLSSQIQTSQSPVLHCISVVPFWRIWGISKHSDVRNQMTSHNMSNSFRGSVARTSFCAYPNRLCIQTDALHTSSHTTTMPFAAINCQIASWRTRVFVNVFTGRTDLEQQQNRCFDAWWWWWWWCGCGCRCLQVDEAKEQ